MTRHRRGRLSQYALTTLKPGQWLSENLGYGKGSLQVRATPSRLLFYYRGAGERTRIPLGPGSGPEAMSLDRARENAWAMATATGSRSGKTGDGTLGALLVGYAERMATRGSATATQVLAMLRRHVERPHPALWMRRARTIGPEDFLAVFEPLVDQGKLPTARKLHASLHAAFQMALQSPFCAQSAEFRRYRVTVNPLSRIRPLEGGPPLPERVLSVTELQALWAHLDQLSSPPGSVLRFYLLTGAQRLEQLLRARREDLVDEGLILWDRKGRRRQPRLHLVPLIAPARLALIAMGGRGPHLVSVDGGLSGLHPSTLWRYVTDVADELLERGVVKARFSPADLRRTVETRLAALKIPPEVRAHLQSHGLNGIQTRHYDRHSYLDEKRDALIRLYRLISGR